RMDGCYDSAAGAALIYTGNSSVGRWGGKKTSVNASHGYGWWVSFCACFADWTDGFAGLLSCKFIVQVNKMEDFPLKDTTGRKRNQS
ncbi:hypothetical protein AVEN_147673-1, partial [Araneus ventricosus]